MGDHRRGTSTHLMEVGAREVCLEEVTSNYMLKDRYLHEEEKGGDCPGEGPVCAKALIFAYTALHRGSIGL